MAQVKAAGDWGGYASGDAAPGLGLSAAAWFHASQVAAVAIDNSYFDVVPNETPDVSSPLHIICIVYMGLLVGEIFDLEALAQDCAEDGVYDFFFVCQPLPFTRAVGSPINPIAIK
jgi:kynurenine formamidase